MTVAAYDHRDLHPRQVDHYLTPSFEGYPQEGDEATVVYRSKRTGDLIEQTGEIVDIRDEALHGSGTTPPSYLEIEIEVSGRDRNLRVWGGGNYSASDVDTEGCAPAQVYTRGLVDTPGGGSTWRTNGLGLLVRLGAEGGATFRVSIENVPSERLEEMPERIEKAVYKRFRNDMDGKDLLEVDVTEVSD